MNDVTFRLPQELVDTYQEKKPPFGFNGVGEFTFYRTYSHVKPDGRNESWSDVVQRVVDETYTIQKRHALENNRPWSDEKAIRSAIEMYDLMWNMKFLPPGRGLWAMGAPVTRERKNYMALQNCAFISTKGMTDNASEPFEFMMDVSMLGVGCGFDTLGAGSIKIRDVVLHTIKPFPYVIPDTREGWVESLKLLLSAYLSQGMIDYPIFYYDDIRPAGEPIKGFGGVSSGPEPLKKLHNQIAKLFAGRDGEYITSRDIVDIMNMIGQCVVAGNVRRTAQLAIGLPEDKDYLDLKNYKLNSERMAYGWTSNNSIAANEGMDYSDAAERTRVNGEPGYIWLDNAREHGRINHPWDFMYTNPDKNVAGFNPCVEQPLENGEVCTLVETFPANHDTVEEYLRTLKFAFLYAKTVTLVSTNWERTNKIIQKNRRIGTSMTGIIQAIEKFGYGEFLSMADHGYEEIRRWDRLYSEWLGINESIRVTTVKPSGTVSLLGGATPGLHRAESEYYIRRVRISKRSPILDIMLDAGYHIEDAVDDPDNTAVIEFPVHVKNVGRTIVESNIEEQVKLAADMQHYWSDNGVSVTVTFREDEGHLIEKMLNKYDKSLKAISFLPKIEYGAFPQMPYEEIDKDTYKSMAADLMPIDWSILTGSEAEGESGCTTDVCEIKFSTV